MSVLHLEEYSNLWNVSWGQRMEEVFRRSYEPCNQIRDVPHSWQGVQPVPLSCSQFVQWIPISMWPSAILLTWCTHINDNVSKNTLRLSLAYIMDIVAEGGEDVRCPDTSLLSSLFASFDARWGKGSRRQDWEIRKNPCVVRGHVSWWQPRGGPAGPSLRGRAGRSVCSAESPPANACHRPCHVSGCNPWQRVSHTGEPLSGSIDWPFALYAFILHLK